MAAASTSVHTRADNSPSRSRRSDSSTHTCMSATTRNRLLAIRSYIYSLDSRRRGREMGRSTGPPRLGIAEPWTKNKYYCEWANKLQGRRDERRKRIRPENKDPRDGPVRSAYGAAFRRGPNSADLVSKINLTDRSDDYSNSGFYALARSPSSRGCLFLPPTNKLCLTVVFRSLGPGAPDYPISINVQ